MSETLNEMRKTAIDALAGARFTPEYAEHTLDAIAAYTLASFFEMVGWDLDE